MKIKEIQACFNNNLPIMLFDSDRENEVDFVIPNDIINSSSLLFMLKKGKGLLCTALDEAVLIRRGFFKLPSSGTDEFATNFFIPVDHNSSQTGISSEERVCTLHNLSKNTGISHFTYPGHISLLGGKGMQNRKGHTEASIELCDIAGYSRAATIIEMLDNKGSTHNIEYSKSISSRFNIPLISIQDIFEILVKNKSYMKVNSRAFLPTEFGDFNIIGFENLIDNKEHFAITKGDISKGEVLVRIHSECVTGDVMHSLKCDCRDQLEKSLKQIEHFGKGIVIYLRQEGRGIGISNKIKTYDLQEKGLDTYDANLAIGRKADERDYAVAAQILRLLEVTNISLLTNNPMKVKGLEKYGIKIKKRIEISSPITLTNKNYILAKIKRFHHDITLQNEKEVN